MITKMILSLNDDLAPAIVEWNETKEDFVVDVPKSITRAELVDLVDEIKRVTEWAD